VSAIDAMGGILATLWRSVDSVHAEEKLTVFPNYKREVAL